MGVFRVMSVRALVLWLVMFAGGATVSFAAAAERVVVRAGIHKDFGRLVFDWSKPVGHSATVTNRILTVRFDRPIDAELRKIRQDLEPYIRNVKLAADKRSVVAALKGNFTVRTSTVGSHVVVDLLKSDTPSKPGPSKADKFKSGKSKSSKPPLKARKVGPPVALGPRGAQPTVAKTTAAKTAASLPKQTVAEIADGRTLKVRTGHHKNYGRLVFGWPRKVGFAVERQGQTVSIKFDAAAELDIAKLRRELPRQISAALLHSNDKGLELGLIVPPDAQLRYFHNETDVVFDVVTQRKKETVRTAAKKKANATVPKPARKKNRKKKERPAPYPFVSVDATQNGGESTFKFNWRRPVSAAVFLRDSSLWIQFDQPARLDMGQIRAVGNSRFRKAEQKNAKDTVHLRLPIPGNFKTLVRREGTVWVVETGPKRKRAIQNMPLQVRTKAGKGAELLVRMEKPGAVSVIRDETVGDAIYAVPVKRTGRGMRRFRRFPDFELLRSPQGISIRPLNDSLRLQATPEGIVITKPGGLNISPEAVAMIKRKPNSIEEKLLDLTAWRHGPVTDFQKVEHELVQYVTQPSGVRRNAARLGLAKFYVSHGMGSEALGVLNTLLKDNPQLLRDPGIRALRGISRYLVGHYAEADADLSHTSLAGIRELYPWRAGIAAVRGDWAGSYRLFVDTDGVMATLPSQFAVKLGLLAAEASLSVKEKEISEARLGALETLPASGGQLDQLAYLKGHLHKLKGNNGKALALWESVVADGARPSQAKAAFAKINLLVESDKLKLPEAIDRLEELQFAWRNSVFEFDLLKKLGDLHARRRDLRSALVTLRRALTLFKDIKGAQSLTQRMREMFRKFYLEGEADHLEPVVALGLYNEFRELTPTGDDGDKMIRRLSERLIKVDLLDDAAKLLDHQIRFRLKGEDRAKTGARLAEILLLDGKPQDALTTLAASKHETLSAPLSEKRRHLEAAALMDSKRYDEALGNIAEDFAEEFDILRAQIFWRAGNWQKASRVLARLTGDFDAKNLSDRDAELLLRRAVALGLASDFAGMKFLRDRFGAAMEKSKQAASFKAVAGGKLLKATDFSALARRAAELDTFRAFIKSLSGKSAKPKPDQTAALN